MSRKQIRAVQYGCGNLGRRIARYMHEKGILIVGAIDSNPAILGKDIGELAGLDMNLGVCIRNDAEAVLDECMPDIAIVTLVPTMNGIYPHIMACVERGIHVITSCEDLVYPWEFSVEKANLIHTAAKKKGVTVAGSGTQELYCNMLRGIATSIHRINKIKCTLCDNTEPYSAAAVEPFGVGLTIEKFNKKFTNEEKNFEPSYLWGQARLIAACMGWTVKSVTQKDVPAIAEEDIDSLSLGRRIYKGEAAGVETRIYVDTYQGAVIEIISVCRAYKPEDSRADKNFWEFEGEPNVHFSMSGIDTFGHTGASIVNRITTVLEAQAGLLTLEQMPMSVYRNDVICK